LRIKRGFHSDGVDGEVTTRFSYNRKFIWIYSNETKDEKAKYSI